MPGGMCCPGPVKATENLAPSDQVGDDSGGSPDTSLFTSSHSAVVL